MGTLFKEIRKMSINIQVELYGEKGNENESGTHLWLETVFISNVVDGVNLTIITGV